MALHADVLHSSTSCAKQSELEFEALQLENDGVDCRADIPDLEPGLEYLVRVSAVNDQGPSPPSGPGQCCSTLSPFWVLLEASRLAST